MIRKTTISQDKTTVKEEELNNDITITINAPYQVDDSHFSPMSEAIKSLRSGAPLTEKEINNYFDETTIRTNRGAKAKDIAELSQEIREKQKEIEKKQKETIIDNEIRKKIEEQNKRLNQ